MYFYDFPVIGAEGKLPLFLLSVGLNEWQYHIINKEGDDCPKLLYCTKGKGVLIVGGRTYNIEPYTAFFIPSGTPHEYYTVGDEWDTHWVIPSGFAAAQALHQLGFDKPLIFPISDIKYLDHCFRKMHESLVGDRAYGNYRASGYMYNFILEFHRLYSGTDKKNSTNSVITNAIDYINANYQKQITLDELCETCRVSKQHLCRLFRSELECRPMEYIAKLRIQKAKELLASTDDSLESISEQVGFCTGSYFSMLFKRYEGITPSEFRNS